MKLDILEPKMKNECKCGGGGGLNKFLPLKGGLLERGFIREGTYLRGRLNREFTLYTIT